MTDWAFEVWVYILIIDKGSYARLVTGDFLLTDDADEGLRIDYEVIRN